MKPFYKNKTPITHPNDPDYHFNNDEYLDWLSNLSHNERLKILKWSDQDYFDFIFESGLLDKDSDYEDVIVKMEEDFESEFTEFYKEHAQ